ncbi:DUF3291 domain-containing protein [Stakelama pacifica]|uniref:Uncharacterized protein DUF3291 n=1 Tax=Stakelama pacifica TaxID=517720 RepID=A0A4V3BSS8_9SPHN|nr:DUF3291 domain-containing protein [Stakelama pacifica]TDN80688.1 uncharacterized protein DUF3291 [Stakelama pacifica]GGO97432.1 hypothetical protein GCM10011329_26280 [Stakelama pacifica]
MVFVSITRLRVRSWRFMPAFFLHARRIIAQTGRAEGFVRGSLLRDRKLTFWTMTLWREQADMKRYMASGAHLKAMPRLSRWCDEASVVHWTQDDAAAPDWREADRRMREAGRPSKVRHPSADHQNLTYAAPRTSGAVAIRPVRARR